MTTAWPAVTAPGTFVKARFVCADTRYVNANALAAIALRKCIVCVLSDTGFVFVFFEDGEKKRIGLKRNRLC